TARGGAPSARARERRDRPRGARGPRPRRTRAAAPELGTVGAANGDADPLAQVRVGCVNSVIAALQGNRARVGTASWAWPQRSFGLPGATRGPYGRRPTRA